MNETNVVVEGAPADVAEAVEVEVTVEKKSPSEHDFVRIWNSSATKAEAHSKFGAEGFTFGYSAMTARAKGYKAKGVNVKDMPQGKRGRKIDVAALNAYAASLPASVVDSVPA